MNSAQVQELSAIYSLLDGDDVPSPAVVRAIRARIGGLLDSVIWMRDSGAAMESLVPAGEVFGANPKQVVRFTAKTARKTHTAVLILPASLALKAGNHPLHHPVTESLWSAISEYLGIISPTEITAGYSNLVYTNGQ